MQTATQVKIKTNGAKSQVSYFDMDFLGSDNMFRTYSTQETIEQITEYAISTYGACQFIIE